MTLLVPIYQTDSLISKLTDNLRYFGVSLQPSTFRKLERQRAGAKRSSYISMLIEEKEIKEALEKH